MKVLLIDPQWQHIDIGPKLALGCLAASISDIVNIEALEFRLSSNELSEISRNPFIFWIKEQLFIEAIIEKLQNDSEVEVIAITGWSGAYPRMLRIANACKSVRSDIKVVFGGSHTTLYERYSIINESILQQHNSVDFLVVGEGEIAFRHLIRQLENKTQSLESINGLVWRNATKVIRNNEMSCCLRNNSPDWKPFVKINRPKRWVYFVETGRGCSYNCAFCDESDLWRKYRNRKVSDVIIDIERGMNDFDTSSFRFSDSTFTTNPDSKLICNELIKCGLPVSWSSFAHSSEITEERVNLLANAGCRCILMGIESGSQRMLNLMRKRTSPSVINNAVAILKKYGIKVRGSFIIGFPGEKIEDVQGTIEFARQLELDAYAWHAYQQPFRKLMRSEQKNDFDHYELDAPFEVCMKVLERNPSLLSDMHTLPNIVNLSKDLEPVPGKWPKEREEILGLLRLAISETSESCLHDLEFLIDIAKESKSYGMSLTSKLLTAAS